MSWTDPSLHFYDTQVVDETDMSTYVENNLVYLYNNRASTLASNDFLGGQQISGNADEVQLAIAANTSQTDDLLWLTDSTGATKYAWVTSTGVGQFDTALVTKTTTYTATANDTVILCDTTSAGFTVTLPAVAGCSGKIYALKKMVAANTLTISGDANIDGSASQTITTQYGWIAIISTGTVWNILNQATPLSGSVTSAMIVDGTIVNADVNASAAIAYSKLNLSNSIVNADVSASAAIAYSKLNLGTSIVNADVSTSAAIAYSKLNLSASVVNGDIATAAAVAYSKLNLSNSIVNADVSTSAAIAYSKLNLSTSILNADINASAAIAYSKLNLSSSIVTGDIVDGTILNADINASAAIAFSKLAAPAADFSMNTNKITNVTNPGAAQDAATRNYVDQRTINSQSGTTYTLVLTDANHTDIEFTSASAVAVTIPTNASVAFPIGTVIECWQYGAGQVTFAGAGGVTLNYTPTAKTRAQNSHVVIKKRGTNEWMLGGDMAVT